MSNNKGDLKNPPRFNLDRSYERYKKDLKLWASVTSVEKAKQGSLVTLSLPETGKYDDLKGKVMDSVTVARDTGLDNIITFLDKHIVEDEIVNVCGKIKAFMECKRKPDQTVKEFVSNFDHLYHVAQVEAKLSPMPGQYLMYSLITNSNISEHDRKLVLSGINLADPQTIFEETKKALIKYCGDSKNPACTEGGGAILSPESTFWNSHETGAFRRGGYGGRG